MQQEIQDIQETPVSLLTIRQVCEKLGLGYTKVYELMKSEGLPVIRFGRSVRIHPESLQQWLKDREQQSAAT